MNAARVQFQGFYVIFACEECEATLASLRVPAVGERLCRSCRERLDKEAERRDQR